MASSFVNSNMLLHQTQFWNFGEYNTQTGRKKERGTAVEEMRGPTPL